MSQGWIGVDLDGTLAKHPPSYISPTHIGDPVPKMLKRVKEWLANGQKVKIMTARVSVDHGEYVEASRKAIEAWCEKHLGQKLEVTNEKDFSMIELWDDRVVRVICDTGETCCERLADKLFPGINKGE